MSSLGGKERMRYTFPLREGFLPLCAILGKDLPEILAKVSGSALERKTALHPFYDRESLFVLAEFVTLDTGTGIVSHCPWAW
jgi:isoleucyl-tRNA synthetase